MRNPRKEKTHEFDLTVPLDKDIILSVENMATDCFGRHWDMGSKECPQCADRDICGIIFKDSVDAKAKEIEKNIGSKFLDEADFDNMTEVKLLDFITSGETTAKDLIQEGMRLSNCDDVIAVKNKLKEWVKSTENVSIKDGVVWVS